MTGKQIMGWITGVSAVVGSIAIIMQWNPYANAEAIREVQQTMKAMEYRFEKRAVIEDIDFLQDELFMMKRQLLALESLDRRTDEQRAEMDLLSKRIHELQQRIGLKSQDILDLEKMLEVGK